MRKKNILDKKIKSIVTRVLNESKPLNEQFGIFCCEPGLCQCQPEFNPGKLPCNGNTAYTQLEDCQNDAGNCCTRWDCDPLGPGICYAPTVNNAAAPFASENDCLTTYPSGCTRTDNDYDCNQQTGNVCGVFVGGPFASENDCLNTYPNGCPQIEDAYECDIPNCQCVVDVNGSFTGVNALTNCTAALADPASECCCEGPCGEMFDCVTRQTAGPVCVPSPTGPFSDMATCNACIADPNCKDCNDPVPERWNCIDRTIDGVTIKVCVIDPLGVFSQEQDCLNCVADPSCEVCNDPDPGKWDCVEDGIRPGDPVGKQQGRGNVQGGMMPTRGGEKVYEKGMMLRESSANMICIPDANGPFMSEIACIDCVNDPLCPECNKIGTGGWDCTGSGCEPGGCTQVNGGQYSSFQECEEQTDDHYNLGFCDCCCPGQPEGCDAAQLISPVMIHNGEYNGIHGQPFMVGDYNLDLNIAKDKDGPLITQAFRTRMAPCGPSYNAPGGNVKHDCSFWEFISEKKLPNRYQSVVHPYSLGGLASQNAENAWQMAHSTAPASGGTSLGGYPFHDWLPGPDGILGNADDTPMIHATTGLPINPHHGQQSGTAHPRWQRRIEAKIAYVMCLRQNCCMNTDWPDSGMVFSPDM